MATPKPSETYSESVFNAIFSDRYDRDDTYFFKRPAGMRDWLIVYTIAGKGYFSTPEGVKLCEAGQVGLLRAGVPHEYGTVAGQRWDFYWVHFQGMPEIDFLPREEVLVQSVTDGPTRERVERAFAAILQDSREQQGLWQRLCLNGLREIVLLMARSRQKKLDARIEDVLQYLSRSMREHIRLERLAEVAGLSASRLAHLFKQETGFTIIEHVNRMRIRHAALLMEHQGRHATEAALDVGYQNYNHFAEQFYKYMGVRPRAYRTRSIQEERST